jgi:antitoxin (DNA-binding transcriptional repressor) of toxin-antitoxin stability system
MDIMEGVMRIVSVAEAKNSLPALISAAENGEVITVTRHGTAVAEIRAIPRNHGVDPASLDWISSQLANISVSQKTGEQTVRAMRDEP